MKSNQQTYAEIAYNAIIRVDKQLNKAQYGQLCHRFPSLVLTNGLRLAVAFYEAKGKKDPNNAYIQYLSDLKKSLGFE